MLVSRRNLVSRHVDVGAQLAAAIKARWVCEQAHQQLKEELGLDHSKDDRGRDYIDMP